jgi:hypothetical protein
MIVIRIINQFTLQDRLGESRDLLRDLTEERSVVRVGEHFEQAGER